MRLLLAAFAICGLFTLAAVSRDPSAGAANTVLSIDTDIIGNGSTTVGSIQPCTTMSVGGSLDVDVVIQDVPSLAGFEADLFYDSTRLTVTAENSSFLMQQSGGFIADLSDPVPDTDGRYHIVVATAGNGTGNGVVVRLRFQANVTGISPLDLDAVKMKDSNNNYVQPADSNGFFTGPVNDGQLAIESACGPDSDGDGIADSVDNCPHWPNPSQALPPWTVPPDDPDCDGFSTANENFIVTDPYSACHTTSTANDEPLPDRWPVDFNDNRTANTVDVGFYVPRLNTTTPDSGYDIRFDLTANGSINTLDLGRFVPFLNKTCS